MQPTAAARAAALLLSFIGAGAASQRSAHADEARACTSAEVQVDENARQVTVSFRNRCEARIGCKVEWSVRCGKGSAEARQEEVRLDGHADGAVVASALHCGDADWRIAPPRWRCDEPSEQVVERSSGTRRKRR